MARRVLPIVYEVDLVDKGSRELLAVDRKVRRELGETTQTLGRLDKAQDRSRQSALALATMQNTHKRALVSVESAQEKAAKATTRHGADSVRARKAILDLEAAELREQRTVGRLATAQDRAAREAREMASASRTLDRAHRQSAKGADLAAAAEGRVQREMRQTRREAGKARFTKGVSGAGERAGRGVGRVGGALTLGAGVGLAAGARSFVDYEAKMDAVAATSDATGKQLEQMDDLAMKLGADTKFSAGQAADAMFGLSKAGFTADQAMKVLPGTMSLAAASGIDLAEATDTQAIALRGFGLDASKASMVADLLTKTVNTSAVDMQDLGLALPYVSAAAKSTGTSLQEVTAMAGLLGNAGIDGEKFGTAIRAAMLGLTNPSVKAQDALKSIGVNANDLAGIPLPQAIGKIAGGLDKLKTRGEKVGLVAQVFGREAAPAVLTLLEQGEKKIDAHTRALSDSEGQAKRTSKVMQDNLKGDFEQLGGSVETAAIKLGKDFGPALREITKNVTAGVNWLGKHEKITAALGITAAGAVTGLAGLAVIAKVTQWSKTARGGLSALRLSMGWMSRSKAGQTLVDDLASQTSGMGGRLSKNARAARAPYVATMKTTGVRAGTSLAANTAETAATQMPTSMNARSSRFKSAGKSAGKLAGRAFGVALVGAVVLVIPQITAEMKRKFDEVAGDFLDDLPGIGGIRENVRKSGFNDLTDKFTPKFLRMPRGNYGGVIQPGGFRRYQDGGLVDAMVSPGENVEYEGATWRVPGSPVAADTVHARLPPGAAVITGHGQRLRAAGASISETIAQQMPHFAKGGKVTPGKYVSTSYGPPWGGIQGQGVTAAGVNLKGNPRMFGVAVDPRLISLGSRLSVWPNPFGHRGKFRAFDTGGAIKGRRVDFYDWRGRKEQNGWGRKQVTVSTSSPSEASSASVTDSGDRIIPRGPLGRSRTRAGLLDDAFGQGVSLGQAGISRASIRKTGSLIVAGTRAALTKDMFQRTEPGDRGGGPSAAAASPRASGRFPSGSGIARMISAAESIDRKRYPYSWGGGHGRIGQPSRGTRTSTGGPIGTGYDCSGAVSAVLAAGGLLKRPLTSGGLMSWGKGGAGKRLAVATDPGHVIMRLGNRWFGTSGQNPGGGAGWLTGNTMKGRGVTRTWPGFRAGGVVPGRALTRATNTARSNASGSLEALDRTLGDAVSLRIGALRRQIDREVKKGGSRRQILRLQQVLDVIDGELGRRVGMAERIVGRNAGFRDRYQAAPDRGLRRADLDPESVKGIASQRLVNEGAIGGMRADKVTLQRALKNAQRAGSREKAAELREQITSLGEDIEEATTKRVELARDYLRAIAKAMQDAAQERVDAASFAVDLHSGNRSWQEAAQRLQAAGVNADSDAGRQLAIAHMRDRAAAATGSVAGLEAQRAQVGAQAWLARSVGDEAGWRSGNLEWQRLGIDITSAMADAAELVRDAAQAQNDAALKLASDMVDAASFGTRQADYVVDRLELEQKLAGTYDSAGGALGRAAAIRETLDERQTELVALQAQKAEAERQGNVELIRTFTSLVNDKQLDILTRMLAAQEATKEATEQTAERMRDLGGSTAFDARGQRFTDLIGIGVGA